MVYTGMKVCLCTLHSKVRINYLWLNRSIEIKMSTSENKLYNVLNGRTEMGYEMRVLVVDIMWDTKKMQTSRTAFSFSRFCSFFLFVSFLYTHG